MTDLSPPAPPTPEPEPTAAEAEHLWESWFDDMIAAGYLNAHDARLRKFDDVLGQEKALIDRLASMGGVGVNPMLILWAKLDKLCHGLLGPDQYLNFMIEFTQESCVTLEEIIAEATRRRILSGVPQAKAPWIPGRG